MERKRVEVVAAILIHNHKLFIAQRGYGKFQSFYELPGGKCEPGETREEALKREIREELDTEISVDEFVTTIEYDYPDFHLTMHCYLCSIQKGNLTLLEHTDAKWVEKEELADVNWLPADIQLIEPLGKLLDS